MPCCRVCKELKDESDFLFRKDTGKYRSDCKICFYAQKKKHYLANKEKILDWHKKYYAKNQAKRIAQRKAHYEKHRDSNIVKARQRYEQNKQSCNERAREDYLKNKTHYRALGKIHYENNKEIYFASNAKRRAALKSSNYYGNKNLTELTAKEAYLIARERGRITGVPHHVDHIVPLNGKDACGFHVWNNLRVVPWYENAAKHNKLFEELL
jgi:hypothetical protein